MRLSSCRAGSNRARDIEDIVAVCESEQAIDIVQNRNRELLKAISRERAELYANLGRFFGERRKFLCNRSKAPVRKSKKANSAPTTTKTLEKARGQGGTAGLSSADPKPRSPRNCPAHRAWIRKHRCSVPDCQRLPVECAHVRTGTDGGAGMKPSDKWAISLCEYHHREQHSIGEKAFAAKYDIDLLELAREFAGRSPHRKRLQSPAYGGLTQARSNPLQRI